MIKEKNATHCKITFKNHGYEAVELNIMPNYQGALIGTGELSGFLSFLPADHNEMILFNSDLIAKIQLTPITP